MMGWVREGRASERREVPSVVSRGARHVSDIEHWIDRHRDQLHDIASRAGANDDTVHYLAILVLGGSSDSDIYEYLRGLIPSVDGQRNPLEGVSHLVADVRLLVETS